MHEFELGVWKAVLAHLIRILHTLGADFVAEFDSRYVTYDPLNILQLLTCIGFETFLPMVLTQSGNSPTMSQQ